jgi:hypothetical protein
MLIDLHVHTSRYSACGRSTPEEMIERAIELGLRGLVFTEHNVLWPEAELAELQAAYPGIRLYRGFEVNAAGGDDYLVYGVTDPELMITGIDDAELISQAQALGGAVVLAHPYRYLPDAPEALEQHPVDGIEIMSSNIYNYAHKPAAALAQRMGVPAIAASDGHHTTMLGMYAMEIERLPDGEHDLVRMLRSGEMQIHVDQARVDEENQSLSAELPEILHLIERGLKDTDIRERLSIYVNLTVMRGLREGRDVFRPYRAALPLSQSCVRTRN